MKLITGLLFTTLTTTLLIGAQATKQDKKLQKTIEIGDRGSKILLSTLGKNMKKNMQKGGVLKTLDFCSNQAYSLTQSVNKKIPVGAKIKRISSKYRSPANAPLTDEVAVLESFKALQESNIILPKHLVQKVDEKTYKYYKPLIIKDRVCLECHGEISKNIDLRRKTAGLYPLDKAVNYKMGDLRGAIVVTVKHK